MVNNKHAFWQALIFTIIIFSIGLIFGYFIESSRSDKAELALLKSEVNFLDEQLRGRIIESSNLSCDIAQKSTFTFADRIYQEALKLEKYDAASKFDRETLNVLHQRYDILRMMLWFEGKKVQERCNGFHTVVYFFQYDPQDVEIRAKQAFFSRLLMDIKNRKGDEILLIPIAANLDLASIQLANANNNISQIPAILIDSERVVDEVVTLEEMERIIFQDNS
ncbi:MAG: hypothetical protein Q8Q31_00790 [Nanoarchaeota archaeon]|nr:hypothetical protein [Nanoarchaeota archaeon]